MIRLVRLSMWDFKGLRDGPHVVEFDNVSLLCGPNGYGKSSIFDAVELCFTGKVCRIERSLNGRIEDARSVFHAKSPLHNSKQKPFRLELEFKLAGQNMTLRLEKSMNGKREKLSQYADGIELSIKEDAGKFQSFDDRQALMKKLGLNSIASTYQLLTYMSQDEADFFLRKRQQERQDWLSVLTNTDEQRARLDKLEKYQRSLARIVTSLGNKIEDLSTSASAKISTAPYINLLVPIELSEKSAFDVENPYAEILPKDLDKVHSSFTAEVEKLDKFASTFDVKEYDKYRKYTFLTAPLKEKGFAEALAAKLLKSKNSNQVRRAQQTHALYKELFRTDKFRYLFVRNLITKEALPRYVSAYTEYNAYADILYLDGDDYNRDAATQDVLKEFSTSTLVPQDELYKHAEELWLQYSKLSQSAANYSKLVSKLATARDDLKECQHDYDQHTKQSSSKCAYCGHNWQTNENLISAYTEQSNLLKDLLRGDGEKLKDILAIAKKTVVEPLKERHKKLQAMHDTYAYTYNGDTQPEYIDTGEIALLAESVIPDFLQNYPLLKSPLESRKFVEVFSDYKKKLNASIDMDVVNFYDKLTNSAQGMDTGLYLTGLERAGFETDLTSKITLSLTGFEKYTRDLSEELTKFAATFTYNPASINSENINTLKRYFDTADEETLINWLEKAKKRLPAKLAYLSDQYTTMRDKDLASLKAKHSKLGQYANELADIVTKCRDALRLYENSQARALQIPFYIISARILQNSPHGEGGLVIKPQKDQDNSKSLIVGVPGETQDVINQLSSGQLMVVALAFFLALNIRNRGKNAAKLLLLDDPVQDMDALNSHALVDVIRREFTSENNEYQLIASTSSDIQMNLMKYKMRLSRESIFKVQDKFFPA